MLISSTSTRRCYIACASARGPIMVLITGEHTRFPLAIIFCSGEPCIGSNLGWKFGRKCPIKSPITTLNSRTKDSQINTSSNYIEQLDLICLYIIHKMNICYGFFQDTSKNSCQIIKRLSCY